MSKELEKKDWIKRTTINEFRLSEIISEYKSLGYEVHLEPVKLEDLAAECKKDYRTQCAKLKTIYIRKASNSQFLFSSKMNWIF